MDGLLIDGRVGVNVARILLIWLILGMTTSASPNCEAPHYREGYVWEDSESALMMNVSIPMAEFAPDRLTCLAQSLKARYGQQRGLTILIFGTPAAAAHYKMPFQGDSLNPHHTWAAQMYAIYFFKPDKQEEYLYLTPDPLRSNVGSPFVTRIDLPATTPTRCKFQIYGRCLLAFEDIRYPGDALKMGLSGKVTLSATIARDGTIAGVHVFKIDIAPPEEKDVLVREPIANLRTWRLEPAAHQDALRITFSYVIDSADPTGNDTDLTLDLPNEVRIRAKPLE
jgi:Gram-negative bacterial TonB protein C-terminal